jgi:hypothetical protein
MKQLLLTLLLVTITINIVCAQEAGCKVLTDSLKGTYTGECKNGKANGQGKAVGINSYDGEFKNGLPEGKGKYTWSNGNYYYGSWKNGLKDGKGELHQFEDGKENRITGYWKKDKYTGEYEYPYRIISTTTDIGRLEVRNMSKKGRFVSLTVKGLLDRTGSSGMNAQGNIATLTDFQIIRGTFNNKVTSKLTNSNVTIFQNVIFPFMATFNFGSSILQIEFFEAGEWDVQVPISK